MGQNSKIENGSQKRSVFTWHIALLMVVPAIAYCNTIQCDYVWLDHTEIEQAGYRITSWKDAKLVWTIPLDTYQLRHDGVSTVEGGYWRPLYAYCISLDWWIWEGNPTASHIVNILLHLGVVVLLYLISTSLFSEKVGLEACFLAALFFGLLPTHVSSVTWISGRKDLLAAFLSLLSLLVLCTQHFQISKGTSVKFISLTFLSALLFAFAVLCKESAFILPIVVTVTFWVTRRLQKSIVQIAILFVTGVVLWTIRSQVTGGMELTGQRPGETIIEQALTISCIWWRHVFAVLFPFDPLLSDRIDFATNDIFPWLAACSLLVVAFLCFTALWKRSVIGFGVLWYAIWVAPTSGVLTLRHWYAERYLYPASWGLLFTTVLFVNFLGQRIPVSEIRRKKIGRLLAALFATTLCVSTFLENKIWRNDQTLFTHAVQQDSEYLEGHSALAALALEQDKFGDVILHSNRILQGSQSKHSLSFWSPFVVHSNLGVAYLKTQQLSKAKQHFEVANRLQPDQAKTYYHLGLVAMAGHNHSDAEDYFRSAIQLNSDDQLSRGNLAFVLLQSGKMESIHECFTLLLPIISADSTTIDLRNFGSAAIVLKEWNSAEFAFSNITQRQDTTASDWAKLAWANHFLGKKGVAIANLHQALDVDPIDRTALAVRLIIHSDR